MDARINFYKNAVHSTHKLRYKIFKKNSKNVRLHRVDDLKMISDEQSIEICIKMLLFVYFSGFFFFGLVFCWVGINRIFF